MRLGRGKLVFQRTSLIFLLRAGESRLSEKERSGFELRPVVWSLFLFAKSKAKAGSARRNEVDSSCVRSESAFICGMYGESHTHEQEAERTANGSGLSKSRMSAWRRAYTFAGYGDTWFAIS